MVADDENRTVTDEEEAVQTNAPFEGFFGSYIHGIDAKGRLIVPSAFRAGLGDKFVIGATMDFKAIALYPTEKWRAQLQKLAQLRETKPKVQLVIDQFSKCSYPETETDAQGRLLLPQKLRSRMIGGARDVEVSGSMDHIRIVAAETAANMDEAFEKEIPDVLEFLGTP